jgi:hypothetical protein
MASDTGTYLLIGVGAAVAWYLYENGYLASVLPASTVAATPAASVSLAGPVQLNQGSNSFSAVVMINGTPSPVTVGISTGVASDSSGNNITADLQAEGVNIPALLQMMQSAYSTPANTAAIQTQATPQPVGQSAIAGLGYASRIPSAFIHGGVYA